VHTKFYLLNIVHPHWRSNAAHYWLEDRGAAPVFYGDYTIAELRFGNHLTRTPILTARALKQANLFLSFQEECEKQKAEPILVSIHNSLIWIYRPTGPPREDMTRVPSPSASYEDLPKIIPIHILHKVSSSTAPLVLASMRCNRALNSGTFAEIDPIRYAANINAIQFLMNGPLLPRCPHPLDVLGAVEFETLVAKIFEEFGCFVPAYRGGTGEDVDLFVHNDANVMVPALEFLPGIPANIQLKLRTPGSQMDLLDWLRAAVHRERYLIVNQELEPSVAARFHESSVISRVLDRQWLLKALNRTPKAYAWLKRSTLWAFPDGW
jgi:hypothetical protein